MTGPRLHAVATLLWAALLLPTLLWWRESILWVATMSLYANVVGHWSAYQAARAERSTPDVPEEDPLARLHREIMGLGR